MYTPQASYKQRDNPVRSCELCGRNMKGQGRNVTIEGAEMLVCAQCAARFGPQSGGSGRKSSVSTPTQRPSWVGRPDTRPARTSRPSSPPRASKPKPRRGGPRLDEMELIEEYAVAIRTARQKKKMSQEELAQRVGERISTLQSIEAGRLKPTGKTIRGLERELEISLLESLAPVPIKPSRERAGSGATLGDIVKVKRKKAQKSE
ncbi:MAG: multiprotein bridging factor aMBF1 [Candidatus Thorarchaeota archaeon]